MVLLRRLARCGINFRQQLATPLFIGLALVCASMARAQSPQEFWREERQRMQPSGTGNASASSPFNQAYDEYVSPYLKKWTDCQFAHFNDAMQNRVKPEDFVRIISGACRKEVMAYSSAIARHWALTFPRYPSRGQSLADELIRDGHNQIVSLYTKQWYSSAKKPGGQNETPTGWTGSGFFVTTAGHILTNAHVAKGCINPTVRPIGAPSVPARVVALDIKNDLALMRAETRPTKVAPLRLTPPVSVGDQVVVFGFPLSGMLSSSGNATFGNVSATMGMLDNPNHLQISAAVQSGNSGGPLLDSSGNVIGIVFAKLGLKAATLTGDIPQNVNFAVKSVLAATFLTNEGIAFERSDKTTELPKAEIVEMAKAFSVEIRCNGANTSSSQAQPPTMTQIQKRSAQFLISHYETISSGNNIALEYLMRTYALDLDYFGQRMSRKDVISQIVRFYNRWPIRKYSIKDKSVSIDCQENTSVCEAKGTILFDARSPERGERSNGQATFHFTLKYSEPSGLPVITHEGGTVVDRSVKASGAE